MPRKAAFLVLILAFSLSGRSTTERTAEAKTGPETRILFTGDILLSRNIRNQIEREKIVPWQNLHPLFSGATWVAGNLEGAVGRHEECLLQDAKAPCFDIASEHLKALKAAGFSALSIENNHSGDLGPKGREQTANALAEESILPFSLNDSPQFLKIGSVTVAVIAINTVQGADGAPTAIPSIEVAQKLRLARRLANLVIVSIHWGHELQDWAAAEQRLQAEWLMAHGADMIAGHHPHVVQPAECIAGRPVFFSLGNHVFDQKYPATKTGLIADCRISGRKMTCGGILIQTPGQSFVPSAIGRSTTHDKALANCTVPLSQDFAVEEYTVSPQPWSAGKPLQGTMLGIWKEGSLKWLSRRQEIVSMDAAPLAGAGMPTLLFSLERHYSPIDKEIGLRPYVYAVGSHGLVAKWRGSALAWPLLDAVILHDRNLVCALHRKDSFIAPDPTSDEARVALYQWNGFGFRGVEDPEALEECTRQFAEYIH